MRRPSEGGDDYDIPLKNYTSAPPCARACRHKSRSVAREAHETIKSRRDGENPQFTSASAPRLALPTGQTWPPPCASPLCSTENEIVKRSSILPPPPPPTNTKKQVAICTSVSLVPSPFFKDDRSAGESDPLTNISLTVQAHVTQRKKIRRLRPSTFGDLRASWPQVQWPLRIDIPVSSNNSIFPGNASCP